MKKIFISLILFFGIIGNTFAEDINYLYPVFGDLPNNTPEDGVGNNHYINPDLNSVNEYCYSLGQVFVSYDSGTMISGKTASFNVTGNIWEKLTNQTSFTKKIVCDDGILLSTGALIQETMISGGQAIEMSGFLESREVFLQQNELFNFYQIELTALLLLTVIVILRKFSFNRKKISFK